MPIDGALVVDLLQNQFPDLARLPVGERHEGGDNVTFRLGDDLAVRLPRRSSGQMHVATEFGWLPAAGRGRSFPLSRPVRIGTPTDFFPWQWSVVTWIDGTTAYENPLSREGAGDLGRALAEVHVPATADAPRNPFRSIPLTSRAERLSLRLKVLAARHGGALHDDVARAIFENGAIQERGPSTWCHLNIQGLNIITKGGRLGGILDWGYAAAGDPATDLGQALVLVGDEYFEALASAYADAGGAASSAGVFSAATTARIRAEGVAYAAMMTGIREDGHAEASWAALVAWGVADAEAGDAARARQATHGEDVTS